MPPLPSSTIALDGDEDCDVRPKLASSRGVTGVDRAIDISSGPGDSSDGDSDDSSSMPYIVDVAAISASLARSMSDKGVQQTESAKRALLLQLGVQSESVSCEADCASDWSDDWGERSARGSGK